MKEIIVTQFLRPHGRKQLITTEVSDEVYAKYEELTKFNATAILQESLP